MVRERGTFVEVHLMKATSTLLPPPLVDHFVHGNDKKSSTGETVLSFSSQNSLWSLFPFVFFRFSIHYFLREFFRKKIMMVAGFEPGSCSTLLVVRQYHR